MLIGLIREGKIPHDKRVPLTPQQCSELQDEYSDLKIIIQPSPFRCYSDEEYLEFGLNLNEDLSQCDILMGIKEVPIDELIPGKKYMFFSHTIKKQAHNQKLLQAIIDKDIELIDYECLTDKKQNRIIGFGRYAGIVGAYNGLMGYGKRYELFHLKPAFLCRDREELEAEMKRMKLPNIKIAITGSGRVANGAMEIMGVLKIRRITPFEFLNYSYREPVYTELNSEDYHRAKDGSPWSSTEFYSHPEKFDSTFEQYTQVCDLLIHCSFWSPRAARLFEKTDLRKPNFHISVIADVSCDINGGIPSTIRSSTIENPFYGYNPATEKEDVPFGKQVLTMMAVDNLPCELPRDASEDFGKSFIERALPLIVEGEDPDKMIERATITRNGKLMSLYKYLSDFVTEKK